MRTQLNPSTIRRLDAVRALAALTVVAAHLFPHTAGDLGPEAVMVFFLLSGFVIYANEHHRAVREPHLYLLRRARRLYPVLIVALIVSVAVMIMDGTLAREFKPSELLAILAFQQTLGKSLNNAPLWSLSFEAIYYVTFPLLMLISVRWRFRFVLVLSAVATLAFSAQPGLYLSAASCLAIWWAGAEAARLYGSPRQAFGPIYIGLGLLMLIAALLAFTVPFSSGFVPFPRPARAYAGALILIWLATSATPRLRLWFDEALGRAAMLAPFSYGLYVIHYPLVTAWSASRSMPIRLLICVPLAFLLAWVAESALRKGGWIGSALSRMKQAPRPKGRGTEGLPVMIASR